MIKYVFITFSLFASFQVSAQVTKEQICKNLPNEEMTYKVLTKDYYRTNGADKKVKLGDSIQLGCSEIEKTGLPIAFMIVFHEKKKVTRKRLRKKGFLMGKPPYSMQMYAVKRNDYMEDEKIINALDYYCYYGQVNYYFMSKEYILFTYTISGDYLVHADLERMAKIENQLVKNLNALE